MSRLSNVVASASGYNPLHEKLGSEDAPAADLVKLRYFAGVSVEEAADLMGVSRSTAYEHWAYAHAWLYCELNGRPSGSRP